MTRFKLETLLKLGPVTIVRDLCILYKDLALSGHIFSLFLYRNEFQSSLVQNCFFVSTNNKKWWIVSYFNNILEKLVHLIKSRSNRNSKYVFPISNLSTGPKTPNGHFPFNILPVFFFNGFLQSEENRPINTRLVNFLLKVFAET